MEALHEVAGLFAKVEMIQNLYMTHKEFNKEFIEKDPKVQTRLQVLQIW